MTTPLRPEEIAAAIAGLEIDDEARKHIESCLLCRAEAAEFDQLMEVRRAEMAEEEPDWEAAKAELMARLPGERDTVSTRGSRWSRPVLALAAALVMAVGIGALLPRGPAAPPVDDVAVEEILAEMDELLADDSIPGFELIDPETDDLETYFDNGAS